MNRIVATALGCLFVAGATLAGPLSGISYGADTAPSHPASTAADTYDRCVREATEQHLLALDAGQESQTATASWHRKLADCRKALGHHGTSAQ